VTWIRLTLLAVQCKVAEQIVFSVFYSGHLLCNLNLDLRSVLILMLSRDLVIADLRKLNI